MENLNTCIWAVCDSRDHKVVQAYSIFEKKKTKRLKHRPEGDLNAIFSNTLVMP